jgi:hypothetical protein
LPLSDKTDMDRHTGSPKPRRFEEVYRQVDAQVSAGQLDPEDARWQLLGQTFRARRAHEEWVRRGAPRRRGSDLAS